MDYVCPDCGYESAAPGGCPECETPLLRREDEDVSEEVEESEGSSDSEGWAGELGKEDDEEW